MVGENWEKNVSKPVFHGRVAFEHDTLSLALCLGWKIHFCLDHTPYKITNWSMIPVVESVFPKTVVVLSIFSKRSSTQKTFYCVGHFYSP